MEPAGSLKWPEWKGHFSELPASTVGTLVFPRFLPGVKSRLLVSLWVGRRKERQWNHQEQLFNIEIVDSSSRPAPTSTRHGSCWPRCFTWKVARTPVVAPLVACSGQRLSLSWFHLPTHFPQPDQKLLFTVNPSLYCRVYPLSSLEAEKGSSFYQSEQEAVPLGLRDVSQHALSTPVPPHCSYTLNHRHWFQDATASPNAKLLLRTLPSFCVMLWICLWKNVNE